MLDDRHDRWLLAVTVMALLEFMDVLSMVLKVMVALLIRMRLVS
jgi:hypothetical protein